MTTQSEGSRGLELNTLRPGSLIDVETKSRHYRIECLGGSSIRISGHPEYCPNPVPAQLEGSMDKAGVVEVGLIGCGKRLMFFLEGRGPVMTSRVVSVQVDSPELASIQ
jgi:hypothetical protein